MSMSNRSLRSSRLLGDDTTANVDPMGSLRNLTDAMFVFCCGLMVALIAHYDVGVTSSNTDIQNGQELNATVTQADQGVSNSGASYAELGTVYQDVSTGQLYIVANTSDTTDTSNTMDTSNTSATNSSGQ
jgi:hypothetical protein